MLDEVQELVRWQQLLDVVLEQVAEQAAKIEDAGVPHALKSRLQWVQTECDNVESALYELRQAVQSLEAVTSRLEESEA